MFSLKSTLRLSALVFGLSAILATSNSYAAGTPLAPTSRDLNKQLDIMRKIIEKRRDIEKASEENIASLDEVIKKHQTIHSALQRIASEVQQNPEQELDEKSTQLIERVEDLFGASDKKERLGQKLERLVIAVKQKLDGDIVAKESAVDRMKKNVFQIMKLEKDIGDAENSVSAVETQEETAPAPAVVQKVKQLKDRFENLIREGREQVSSAAKPAIGGVKIEEIRKRFENK